MTDFCAANNEVITESNYMETYGLSSLPSGGAGFPQSSISANGLVNQGDLNNQISGLLSRTNAVAPDGVNPTDLNPAGNFASSAASLRAQIQKEYCFYYKRYMFILTNILMTAATSTTENSPDYNKKKENTELLNSRLNQILQLLQALVNSRLNTLKTYYGQDTGVNVINAELDKNRNELIKHSTLLKNQQLEADVKMAMVDYTLEKNSSSRNLLAIYGFMNIVAGGLIFYLYRSSNR